MTRVRFIVFLLAASCCLLMLSPGCDELITETIEVTIAGHPTAEFTIGPDSGCLLTGSFDVDFDDASTGPVVRWRWDFGDGDTAIIEKDTDTTNGDVSHSYTEVGAFTIKLAVFDSLDGSDVEIKKRAVIVGHNLDSMTVSDTLVCPGDVVRFTVYNPYGVDTLRWNFGDGTQFTDTSLSLDTAHAFTNPGVYKITLTARGDCGITVLTDTIHVLRCAEPWFVAEPWEGCVPMTVQFTDSTELAIVKPGTTDTVGIVVAWDWDFGDGNTSTLRDDVNTYTTEGTYEVTLTVTTDSGGVTSYTDTIIAWPAANAEFTANPLQACQTTGRQFVVSFKREPTGDTAWLWDFDDGTTSDVQNPYHAYITPGLYSVKLIAYGACGTDSTEIVEDSLIEYADTLPPAVFSITPDTALVDSIFTFTDLSANAPVKYWEWDFGDGTPFRSDSVVNHSYDSAATYVVKLTIFNQCHALELTDTIVVIDTLK